MFKALVANCILLAVSIGANAQSKFLDSPDNTKKFAEGIVASIASGNMSGATKELRQVITSTVTEFDLFEAQLATQADNFLSKLGSPKSYEFAREQRLGTHLILQQFLVLHEKAPLRVNFVFYKTSNGWVVTDFYFETNAMTFFK